MRFAEAVVRGSIQLEALPDLVRAFPTWLGVTRFTRTRSQPLAEGTFCRPVYIGTVSRTVMTRPPITSGQSLASAVATAMLAASLIVWVRAKREAARSWRTSDTQTVTSLRGDLELDRHSGKRMGRVVTLSHRERHGTAKDRPEVDDVIPVRVRE